MGSNPVKITDSFELYQYRNADGSFSYDKYRQIQTSGNKRKIGNIWVIEDNIKFLSGYIKTLLPSPQFGLCHGTRRGKEQEWFQKYLGGDCEVIGTEISDTATQFPNTIQWDFHDVKEEWVDAVDFIYSNSFDHSYDPKVCLNAWMSCIKPGGVCILEHSSADENATELDPFGANVIHMPYLVLDWAEGEFFVSEILNAPSILPSLSYIQYLVIQRNV
jgi:hypothetical protein